jgi:hypothetical protein
VELRYKSKQTTIYVLYSASNSNLNQSNRHKYNDFQQQTRDFTYFKLVNNNIKSEQITKEISHRVTQIKILVLEMTEARKVTNHLESQEKKAFAY